MSASNLSPDEAATIARFDSCPAAPESYERRVSVSWRTCQCEWWTKACEEMHTRHTMLPLYLVEEHADRWDQP